MKRVLDVGSSNVSLSGIARFDGWKVETFDMDEEAKPTYLGNVLYIERVLWPMTFDAVYASHILEHLAPSVTVNVLRQFSNILSPNGWLEVWVPDIMGAFDYALRRSLSLWAPLYEAKNGSPVTLLDMLYGWDREVRKGKDGYAHRTAFDWPLLEDRLREAGYPNVQPLDRGNAFEVGYCAWFGQRPGWLPE